MVAHDLYILEVVVTYILGETCVRSGGLLLGLDVTLVFKTKNSVRSFATIVVDVARCGACSKMSFHKPAAHIDSPSFQQATEPVKRGQSSPLPKRTKKTGLVSARQPRSPSQQGGTIDLVEGVRSATVWRGGCMAWR